MSEVGVEPVAKVLLEEARNHPCLNGFAMVLMHLEIK